MLVRCSLSIPLLDFAAQITPLLKQRTLIDQIDIEFEIAMQVHDIRQNSLRLLTIFAAYVGLSLLMTYPLVLNFTTHTPDSGGEPSIFLWNLWYFHQTFPTAAVFKTDLLLAPFEANLVFHTYTIGRNLLAYPLLSFVSVVTASNLLLILSFGLSGLAVYLLTFDRTQHSSASFVAGLIYTFSPYRFAQMGHYNLSTLEWLPLAMLFTWRYLEHGKRHQLILAALFSLWVSINSYYYSIYFGLWAALASLLLLLHLRSKEFFVRLIKLGTAVVVIHMPLLWLMWQARRSTAWVGVPEGEAGGQIFQAFSADLAAYLTPNLAHPLLANWQPPLNAPFRGEWVVYFGVLSFIGIIRATHTFRRSTATVQIWTIAFWVFLLLSLGTYLQWNGTVTAWRLPFYYLTDVPILREARVLSRYGMVATLSVAVLTGVWLAGFVRRLRVGFRPILIWGCAAFVLFEFLPAPLQLADRAIPEIYHVIAQDPVEGTVLDLPFGLNDSFRGLGGWNPKAMYFQTVTNRPIIGAHISRIPPERFAYYEGLPIIGRLAHLESGGSYAADDVEADRRRLTAIINELNLRYIVLPEGHKGSTAHRYVLDVWADCLRTVADDGIRIGYFVSDTCR